MTTRHQSTSEIAKRAKGTLNALYGKNTLRQYIDADEEEIIESYIPKTDETPIKKEDHQFINFEDDNDVIVIDNSRGQLTREEELKEELEALRDVRDQGIYSGSAYLAHVESALERFRKYAYSDTVEKAGAIC